ncbi:MAG: winged helix-turn-helix transcriptional regulator [Desulfomonilaceae bacterium]
MPAFQETREQAEQENLLQLMSKIETNPSISQRALASELGIALGLMNTYLKRCVKKGWVRASQVSPRRISYFLTPEGFVEKSRMITSYLSRSLTLFRDAKTQCESTFNMCRQNGWGKIAIVGESDLTDIALMVAHGKGISVEKIDNGKDLTPYDAILITDMNDPQSIYDNLKTTVNSDRLLFLEMLHISRRVDGDLA